MIFVCWFLAAWFMLSATMAVSAVGQPRKPMTSGQAAFIVLLNTWFASGLALIALGVLR
jgi:hypothetical protein